MLNSCKRFYQFGKSIGNPTRFRILELLRQKPMPVNSIVRRLHLSQPAVSQHLRLLRENNIVEDVKRGQEVYYSVNYDHLGRILRELLDDFPKDGVEAR